MQVENIHRNRGKGVYIFFSTSVILYSEHVNDPLAFLVFFSISMAFSCSSWQRWGYQHVCIGSSFMQHKTNTVGFGKWLLKMRALGSCSLGTIWVIMGLSGDRRSWL